MAKEHEVPDGVHSESKLRVMVIDDDVEVREALGLLLHADGYLVTLCSSAAQALGHLREAPAPDLIVLDLLMPEINGWEFRVEQKKEPRWASIPIIALSADRSAQARAIDAAAYLSKPIGERAFLESVRLVGQQVVRTRTVARAAEFQRLVSLGSLVGGLSHEVNNPLAVVDGTLDVLQRQLIGLANPLLAAEPFAVASALRAVERAKAGIMRITEVVRCVSMFALADPELVEALDIHEVLESSLQVAANELRHCADVERVYGPLPRVRGNPARLGQVFLNLLLNAAHSIRDSPGRAHSIRVSTLHEAESVLIRVTDTAEHTAADLSKDVFDPLSSVTLPRLGLRFGLAISRELIEGMGGTIDVVHEEPVGTSFLVRLPALSGALHLPPARTTSKTGARKRSAILIVDDDAMICEILAAHLSEDYDVAAFTSPRAALASMLEGNFSVILCDVMMPVLNGIELFERATRERPDLENRFIFITGGAFTDSTRSYFKRTGRTVLLKPCSRAELLQTVHATILVAKEATT